MLSKAHLTSHSRISGSRWEITPSWLPGSWRSFFYSSVYSFHLFLISSASVRSLSFLSLYCSHRCMRYSLGISNFLEEISRLSHSVLFLYFFALIAEESFLISSCYFWDSAFRCLYLSFSPLLFASFLFTAICKASPDSHFVFFAYLFLGDGLDPCLLYNVTNLIP